MLSPEESDEGLQQVITFVDGRPRSVALPSQAASSNNRLCMGYQPAAALDRWTTPSLVSPRILE